MKRLYLALICLAALCLPLSAQIAPGQIATGHRLVKASGGSTPIALVAHTFAISSGGGTIDTTANPLNCTGANFIDIAVSNYVAPPATPISDSVGTNTYVKGTNYSDGVAVFTTHFWALNANVSSSMTFTLTGGSIPIMVVSCWSNVKTSAAQDQENGTGSNVGTPLSTGAITPTVDGELLITAVTSGDGTTSGAQTMAAPTGFTGLENVTGVSGNGLGLTVAYQIQTTATSRNPTWDNAGRSGTINRVSMDILSFKPQ